MEKEFPFVGRVAEMAHTIRLLRKAWKSRKPLNIVVVGERGIGKTRFLKEVKKEADGLGYGVLSHRCQEWDRYYPLRTVEALIRLLLGESPEWRPKNPSSLVERIGSSFPKLSMDEQEERFICWFLGASEDTKKAKLEKETVKGLAGSLLNRFLEQKSKSLPLLVLIDDIHYSDVLSREIFANRSRRVTLLVSTLTSSPSPFQRPVEMIRLVPLTARDIERLLVEEFGEETSVKDLAEQLYETTDGYPLHIVQILASIQDDEDALEKLRGLVSGKETQRAFKAVVKRLRLLDADSLKLLKAASLIADRVPFSILRRLFGHDFPYRSVLSALQRYRLAHIEVEGETKVLCFSHGVVKEAAFSLLEEDEKKRLRIAVADELKRHYERNIERYLVSIASLYEDAGEKRSAADTYLKAGEHFLGMGVPPSAEEAFRKALRLSKSKRTRQKALLGLMGVLDIESRLQECVAVAERFFALSPPPDIKAEGLVLLSHIHTVAGNLSKAEEYAQEALEEAEEGNNLKVAGRALTLLAVASLHKGDIGGASRLAKKSKKVAERLEDPYLLGSALNTLGIVSAAEGRLNEARSLFRRSAEEFRKAGYLLKAATITGNVAATMVESGEFKDAVSHYIEAIEVFRKLSASDSDALARHNTAVALIALGEYKRALQMLRTALGIFRRTKSPLGKGRGLVLKASCLLKMGRLQDALTSWRKAEALIKKDSRWVDDVLLRTIRTEIALYQKDIDEALSLSEKLLEEAEEKGAQARRFRLLTLRLRVLIAAERLDEAELIASALEKSAFKESPHFKASAKATLAQFYARKGEIEKAEKTLEEALGIGNLSRDTYAETYLILGGEALKAGKPQKAEKFLKTAEEEYSHLVEKGYREDELKRVREHLKNLNRS